MKKGMLKKFLCIAAVGIMSIGMFGCGKQENNKLEQIKENGKLVVGLSADYAPYEFHILDEQGNDVIVGFDVDIAEEIAKEIGVELEIQDMDFGNIVAGISTGKIDLGISGLTPDEERKKSIDFSDIYYVAEHGYIVRAEDKDKYTSLESLKGQKVGAQMGAIQAEIAETNIPEADIQLLANVNDLVLSLKSGKIEALVVELPVAEMIVKNNPELAVGEETVTDAEGGSAVGIQKGQEELLEVVNNVIKKIQDEGLLDQFIIDANSLAEKQVEKE